MNLKETKEYMEGVKGRKGKGEIIHFDYNVKI